MPSPTVYGPLVSAATLDAALIQTLRAWMPAYVAEAARQDGLTPLPVAPRSYLVASELDRFEEDQIPSVVVVSPGMSEPPEVQGDGHYRAWWEIGVSAITTGRDADEARRFACIYAAAARGVLIQHPSLGGVASAVAWTGERYDDIQIESRRTLCAGQVTVRVLIEQAAYRFGGPPEPPEDPAIPDEGIRPSVDSHATTVNPRATGDAL